MGGVYLAVERLDFVGFEGIGSGTLSFTIVRHISLSPISSRVMRTICQSAGISFPTLIKRVFVPCCTRWSSGCFAICPFWPGMLSPTRRLRLGNVA